MRRPLRVPVTVDLLKESQLDPSQIYLREEPALSGVAEIPKQIFRSHADVVEFVERFQYKPNCQIKAWIDGVIHPRLVIHMIAKVPDSTTAEHRTVEIAFTQTYALDYIMLEGPRYVFKMMQRYVEDWEKHESLEWLAFDGARLVDPHPKPVGILNAV
jgi:hypothetical protein